MNTATPNMNESSKKSKRTLWAALVIAAVLLGAFLLWALYLSPEAKQYRQDQENTALYNKAMTEFENKMKNDTYGGKTPEETLNMFIEAVKKDDLDLASKYFLSDAKTNWLEILKNAKDDGRLVELSSVISGDYSLGDSIDGYSTFIFKDKEQKVLATVDFSFNKYSGVWKIESL